MNRKVVILLSGGQDSVTCLFWALKMFDEVHAVSFDYGQRHAVELEMAKILCADLKIAHTVFGIGGTLIGSSLIEGGDVNAKHNKNENVPSSFVPARNALFLTIAAGYAFNNGIKDIVIGACQTDYSGYPDCRRVFVDSMVCSLSLAMGADFKIHTPLMYLTKAETWELADQFGALQIIVQNTRTCYNGDVSELHSWGYGCGECPSCLLRKKGFEEYQQMKNSFLN